MSKHELSLDKVVSEYIEDLIEAAESDDTIMSTTLGQLKIDLMDAEDIEYLYEDESKAIKRDYTNLLECLRHLIKMVEVYNEGAYLSTDNIKALYSTRVANPSKILRILSNINKELGVKRNHIDYPTKL